MTIHELVRIMNKFYTLTMSETPFRDQAEKIARRKDYVAMSYESDRARSHGWWKNLVEYGAWKGPGSTRVGPPDPEALEGIAKLFGTTIDRVAAMVAADWYEVYPDAEISARALSLGPTIDLLSETDAELVEALVHRLASDGASSG
jgi:hypothetical protein